MEHKEIFQLRQTQTITQEHVCEATSIANILSQFSINSCQMSMIGWKLNFIFGSSRVKEFHLDEKKVVKVFNCISWGIWLYFLFIEGLDCDLIELLFTLISDLFIFNGFLCVCCSSIVKNQSWSKFLQKINIEWWQNDFVMIA